MKKAIQIIVGLIITSLVAVGIFWFGSHVKLPSDTEEPFVTNEPLEGDVNFNSVKEFKFPMSYGDVYEEGVALKIISDEVIGYYKDGVLETEKTKYYYVTIDNNDISTFNTTDLGGLNNIACNIDYNEPSDFYRRDVEKFINDVLDIPKSSKTNSMQVYSAGIGEALNMFAVGKVDEFGQDIYYKNYIKQKNIKTNIKSMNELMCIFIPESNLLIEGDSVKERYGDSQGYTGNYYFVYLVEVEGLNNKNTTSDVFPLEGEIGHYLIIAEMDRVITPASDSYLWDIVIEKVD